MELALILVMLVIIELGLTFYFLGRLRDYKKTVNGLVEHMADIEHGLDQALEHITDAQASIGRAIYSLTGSIDYDANAGTVQGAIEDVKSTAETLSLQDLVSQATPEDLAKAEAILKGLGFGD